MTQIPDAAVQAACEIIRAHDTEQWGEDGGNEMYWELVSDMLTAAYPHLPLGYEVKKLAWEGDSGTSLVFNYTVAPPDHTKGWRVWVKLADKHASIGGAIVTLSAPDEISAKAAAQADFERRVRECVVAKPVDVDGMDDESLQAKISEIGNQIHNLSCEYQNNEPLSERLQDLRGKLWDISKRTTKPVDVAAVREAISSVNIHDEANNYEWRGDGDYTPNEQEKALLEDFGNSLVGAIEDAIRALSAEPAQDDQWRYRMLQNNDLIEENDEFLGDDAATWDRLGMNWAVGHPYHRGLKPARRPLPAAPTSEVEA